MNAFQLYVFSGPVLLGLFGVCIGLFELARIKRRRRAQEAFDHKDTRLP